MGNQRVAVFTSATTGAIAYVEYAYAKQNKLSYALLRDRDGAFMAPSSRSFQSAAANTGSLSASANQHAIEKSARETELADRRRDLRAHEQEASTERCGGS
jgi:ABC-type phosphate transport system substrate-binding protein